MNPRCQALIRGIGSYRYHEQWEHHPVSEQPNNADIHAIKALCYWLYAGGVGAVDKMIDSVSDCGGIGKLAKRSEFGLKL